MIPKFEEIRKLINKKYLGPALKLLDEEGPSEDAIKRCYASLHKIIGLAISYTKTTDQDFKRKIKKLERFINIKEIDWDAQRLTDSKVSIEEWVYWNRDLPYWVQEKVLAIVGDEIDRIDDKLRDKVGMRWLEIATGQHPHLQNLKKKPQKTIEAEDEFNFE